MLFENMNHSQFAQKLCILIGDEELRNRLGDALHRFATSSFSSESLALKHIEIYNDVGRRDVDTIQGNANPAEGVFVTSLKENDSSATEVITLTPPTGLSAKVIFTIQVLSVVLSAIAILTVGIIAIKKKVLTK